MFGISAFSQSPFASLGGTPVRVDLSGLAVTASLSDPTLAVVVTIDAEANVTPSGQVGTGGAPTAGVNAQAIASLPTLVGTVGSVSVTTYLTAWRYVCFGVYRYVRCCCRICC